ncbi:hypothetical protein LCGC14_1573110 [marine sediment metagenome]|uniref:Uncharacterized protein n=1 Tax=marine sediment metagenome TaxID=412755 RepID=A0A0F9LJJ4_9ZZZZ
MLRREFLIMAFTFWTTAGKIIKDALGKIISCENCPCDGAPCTDCTGSQPNAQPTGACSLQTGDTSDFEWVWDSNVSCLHQWLTEIGGVPVLNGTLEVDFNISTEKWSVVMNFDDGVWGNVIADNTDANLRCLSMGKVSGTVILTIIAGHGGCTGQTITVVFG